MREFSGGGDRGTVLFTTGVFGIKRYDEKPERKVTIDVLRQKGFQVFQVEWGGGRRGWGTGAEGAGFSRALCAYAEVVRWVIGSPARNREVACAQGNSGGSLQNAYGLAVHGLDAELDLVIFSGGPPVTNIDKFCFGQNRESGAKDSGRRFVEYVQGWNESECRVGSPRRNSLEAARADSLIDELAERDLDYPETTLHFVLSERDRSHIEGRRFHDAIESSKEWHWIPGHTHGVDATPEGARLMRDLFDRDCKQD